MFSYFMKCNQTYIIYFVNYLVVNGVNLQIYEGVNLQKIPYLIIFIVLNRKERKHSNEIFNYIKNWIYMLLNIN